MPTEEQEKLLLTNQDLDEPDQKAFDDARKVIGKLKGRISNEDIVKEHKEEKEKQKRKHSKS